MKQTFDLMVYLLLCFILSSCSVELKDRKASVPSPTTANGPKILSISELRQEIRGLDQPNQYEYHIRWPDFKGDLRISEGGRMLAVLSGDKGQFTVNNLKGGAELNFLFEQIVDGKITANFLAPVVVPRDFEISGVSFLSQDEVIQAERVFLKASAVIFTREHNLQIKAKELYADGASFRNFAESDSVSERERNGKAGGAITLNIGRAIGQLEVELSGEAAGRGRDGVRILGTGHRGCWGTSGGNGGDAGQFILDVRDDSHFRYHIKNRPGLGGLAGSRGSASIKAPRSESVFPCHTTGPGDNGIAGRPGRVCIKRGMDKDLSCSDL